MTNGHSIHKNKGFAPQTPENDENDENGGCHARKDPVCQKPCFCTPDKEVFCNNFGRDGNLSSFLPKYLPCSSFLGFSVPWLASVMATTKVLKTQAPGTPKNIEWPLEVLREKIWWMLVILWQAILLAWYRPHFGPPARNRKKTNKKNRFRHPPENRKEAAEK